MGRSGGSAAGARPCRCRCGRLPGNGYGNASHRRRTPNLLPDEDADGPRAWRKPSGLPSVHPLHRPSWAKRPSAPRPTPRDPARQEGSRSLSQEFSCDQVSRLGAARTHLQDGHPGSQRGGALDTQPAQPGGDRLSLGDGAAGAISRSGPDLAVWAWGAPREARVGAGELRQPLVTNDNYAFLLEPVVRL